MHHSFIHSKITISIYVIDILCYVWVSGKYIADQSQTNADRKHCFLLFSLGVLDLKTSQYRESHKRADGCFRIALAALWCHTLIILRCAASSPAHLVKIRESSVSSQHVSQSALCCHTFTLLHTEPHWTFADTWTHLMEFDVINGLNLICVCFNELTEE